MLWFEDGVSGGFWADAHFVGMLLDWKSSQRTGTADVGIRFESRIIRALAAVALVFLVSACAGRPANTLKQQTFHHLDRVRAERKARVMSYFDEMREQAWGVLEDVEMRRLYTAFLRCEAMGRVVGQARRADLEQELKGLYAARYADFYDILFVDGDGFVFSTVKHESDFGANLLTDPEDETKLGLALRSAGSPAFVDYEYYSPSEEPAAFFVVPLECDSGAIVLQLPINRVNSLLSQTSDLGRTGETYLVNEQKLMLTESRFYEADASLSLSLETEAVRQAMNKGIGREIIHDYRGVPVFSSFERFEVMGTAWMLLVEIDEDEVITEHYRRNENYYASRFVGELARRCCDKRASPIAAGSGRNRVRVDVEEIAFSNSGQILETRGVGPCTALAVLFPGEFAYLAHISPVDEIYEPGWLQKRFLGEERTDFLPQLIGRILRFHLCPADLGRLRFVFVATHDRSLAGTVRALADAGVDLSQITPLVNPEALYADVSVDQAFDTVHVDWVTADGKAISVVEDGFSGRDLGEVVKEMLGYDNEAG